MKWRKSNRAKRVAKGCRNNRGCPICEGNRLHFSRVRLQKERHVNDPICRECFDKLDSVCVVFCEHTETETERALEERGSATTLDPKEAEPA
jgi:hypothetical protein